MSTDRDFAILADRVDRTGVEIARRDGVTPSAVYMRSLRARRRLAAKGYPVAGANDRPSSRNPRAGDTHVAGAAGAGILFLLAALAGGCSHHIPPRAVAPGGGGLDRIVARTESAGRAVRAAMAETSQVGKAHLAVVLAEQDAILDDVGAVQAWAVKLEDTARRTGEKLKAVEAKWYVRWGRRIERALWIVGIGWLLAGIASVVLGLGNPLSWSWKIGKEITRLVPMMNPFSWMRDWLLRRKSAAKKGR